MIPEIILEGLKIFTSLLRNGTGVCMENEKKPYGLLC